MTNWLGVGSSTVLCLQWIAIHLSGAQPPPHWAALSSGAAIFGAALMLSWAAELAQKDIPQTLAIALLGLIVILPEYAVDMYFAWQSGKDPTYTSFSTASMTVANRLLIGVGWGAVVVTFWLKTRQKAIHLEPEHRTEIFYLALATLYSFMIPFKGRLDLVDAAVFIIIFACYMRAASKAMHVDPALEGTPAMIEQVSGDGMRRCATAFFFLLSGLTIFTAAEPFAEGLLVAGRTFGTEEFTLVQWLAPLASEAPEFIVAILFALRARPSTSMGALLSSKVNQWTLLMGTLPVVFALSAGRLAPMALDQRQIEEMFLTSAQSLFAVTILANLSFSLLEALVIFLLFSTQLFFSDPQFRFYYSFLYVALAVGMIVFKKEVRQGIAGLFYRGSRRAGPQAVKSIE